MDSGNSSSMQSSSGGDDQEYDSISLLHHNIPAPPPPQPLVHLQPQQPDFFKWAPAPPPRSDPNSNVYLSFTGAEVAGNSTAPPPSSSAAPLTTAGQPPPPKSAGPSKNPKKRTRASRRAPTTVLTTDTTNFRAMVQEFTGIPDPPFSASSRRLDLLSTAGSSMRLAAAAASLSRGPPFRPAPLQRLMNQDPLGAVGSGQPDPTLAFQSFIQQPLVFSPPSNMNSSGAFGIGMHPPAPIGVGFGSSTQPESGGTTLSNDNYLISCAALTSPSSTDLVPSEGNNAQYRNH